MNRRILLGGAASAGLLAASKPAVALPPQFTAPQKSARQLNLLTGRTQLVSVGNWSTLNGGQQTSAGILNASANPISQQLTFVAPANQAISNLQIGMPGFFVEANNESLNTLTIQWRVAVEYPTATTLMDATWNGQPTLTVTPAKQIYWSDNVNVEIPAGAVYTVRMYGVILGMSLPVFGITVSGGAITAVGALAIASMAWTNGVVSATGALAHGLPVGITFPVTVAGVTPAAYNGSYTATVTGASTFSFPLAANPGAVTTQGTYISYGQGLQNAPTVSLSGLGAGTGGSVTPVWNFSVGQRVPFTSNGVGYSGSPVTVTSSGGGGSVQPTWQARIKNNAVVDLTLLTPGSSDFTSAPTLSFSGGNGSNAAATATLAGGVMVGLPAFVAGSGYTNGTFVASFPTNGINMVPGAGNYSFGQTYRSYVYTGPTALDYTPNVAGTPGGNFSFFAFNPLIRAQISSASPCVGIVGTSIEYGYQDVQDFNGVFGYIAKSLAGDAANGGTGGLTSGLPYINISRSSSNAISLLGSGRGQMQALIDCGATHIVCGHPRNDLNNGVTSASALSLMQVLWAIWQNQGIPVFATTILPYTTSTNGWIDQANQTTVTPFNTQRLAYNAALRANYASYGVQLIDVAAFFELGGAANPQSAWNFTGNAGTGAGLLCTISSGAVNAVTLALRSGGIPSNTGYLGGGSGTVPLVFFGGGGSGAAGTANVISGVVQSSGFSITSGGSGYTAPPLVAIAGALTPDGIHPSAYGYLLATANSGLFLPSRFSL